MSKIGFTTLRNTDDTTLSPHFGLAKWVMIRDNDTGETSFERNTGLYGRAVVDMMARAGCGDAVFTEIGAGALRHLREAGIRGWLAPANVPVAELLDRLGSGELTAAWEATHASQGAAGRVQRGAGRGYGRGAGRGRGCGQQQRHQHAHAHGAGRGRRNLEPET